MLLDLFFEEIRITRKKRIHFNAFMTDVQLRLHACRLALRAGKTRGEDPIPPTAAALAAEIQLLCLDEFAVTNIADAMILGRLFEALFAHDMLIVTTSNIAPDDLYRDGLNRALFLPFIALLKERMEVVHVDARKDFRLEKLAGAPVFYVPADAGARAALDRAFTNLTGRRRGMPTSLHVLGHDLIGAVDYVALAEHFHTLILDDVPVIAPGARDVAQRFILLIDTLYDRRVKLIASAAAEPFALYRAEEGREAFEFRRTASRLVEMQSNEYFALPRGRPAEISGIAET
jgi:cell division protein ZapE